MRNPYALLKGLFPNPPLQVGTVTAYSGGVAVIQLPDGGVLQARGAATVGNLVFVRDNVIEGQAPSLTYVEVEL